MQAAEAETAQAAAEMEQAAKALTEAKAQQTARETDVVRLKEEAAKNPPPADITAKLAAARAARARAKQATTNALEMLQAKTKTTSAAKEKLAQANSENPTEIRVGARQTTKTGRLPYVFVHFGSSMIWVAQPLASTRTAFGPASICISRGYSPLKTDTV